MSALYEASHERTATGQGTRHRAWLGPVLALAVAAAAVAAAVTLPTPTSIDQTLATPALPPVSAFDNAAAPAGVSTASVDWGRVEVAPDPSPMAVAAYGD